MTALSDRYELADQVGAGGMAQVWLGKDRVLGRTVAVKTLLEQYAGDPHFIERFRREAQNAASLNHPNIVSVYDTGSDDGTHYIVMEFVTGRTLRDVIRDESPLLPERVAEIGAEVCAGMSFAHQHGIIHRDIKPANIMITSNGAVKVADFGIARAASGESVTQTAMVLGTAQYFSPEQAQGQAVDARSDLYSLGVVLYEMLTRQVPFTGSSPVAIAYKHVKEAPLLPSRLNPDVPAALEAIVMKALAKNPENRYQTSDEMREDLLRALHGRPVEAPPVLADATGIVDLSSAETQFVDRTALRSRREQTPEERRRRTGIYILVAIGLAILGTAAWAIIGLIGGSSEGTVPRLLGLPINQAIDRLQSAGFKYQLLESVYSDAYPAGRVAVQNPVAGTRIDKGEVPVKLAASLGIETVRVPDVTGLSRSTAITRLKNAGLKEGDITFEQSSSVRRGYVISQNPSATSLVAKGSEVKLVVSSGPPTQEVPSVVGLPLDEAQAKLTNFGFKWQTIAEPQGPDCDQPEGYVCRQDPAAGDQQAQGSTVTIWYAQGEPSPSPTPTPTDQPTETPSP
jgi:serine/threonine-protein kinase